MGFIQKYIKLNVTIVFAHHDVLFESTDDWKHYDNRPIIVPLHTSD